MRTIPFLNLLDSTTNVPFLRRQESLTQYTSQRERVDLKALKLLALERLGASA